MIRESALAVCIALSGCHSRPRTRLTANGTEVRQVSRDAARQQSRGSDRAPSEGDWVINGHTLHVSITGTHHRFRNEPPGTITEFTHPGHPRIEPLRTLEFIVRVGQRELPLERESFEAVEIQGNPALRLHAWVTVDRQRLELVRTYLFERGRNVLRVTTRLTHRGQRALSGLRVGARLNWGGDAPFAPGIGTLDTYINGQAPWLGLARDGLAVAITRPRGLVSYHVLGEDPAITPAGTQEPNGTQPETELFGFASRLTPGTTRENQLMVFMVSGDLSTAARAVMLARREPFAEQSLRVLGADDVPATVMVSRRDGHMALRAGPTHSLVTVPLAPGKYTAWATAPGHAVGDPVAFQVRPGSTGTVAQELVLPRGARIRVTTLDADSTRPLPARVTVRGVAPTPDPFLGPNSSAAGAGVVILATEGRAEFPVAPGRYTVTVSHGPLWSVFSTTVTITDSLRGDVTATLHRELSLPGWVGCDFHVHAARSFDSHVTLEDRVASLTAEDIRFAVPTEHNVVGDYSPGVSLLPPALRSHFAWVPAVEITTDRSAQPWGHFNVFPYPPDPELPNGGPPPFLNVSPRTIFRAARSRSPDAFIQVNHPRMTPNIGYFNVTGLDPRTRRAISPEYDPTYDAIEVFNGFYIGRLNQVENVLHDWLQLLVAGARYIATGSSDSHNIAYQWAGWPRTMVHLLPEDVSSPPTDPDAAPSPEAILRALRHGRAMVTSGPMLFLSVSEHEPGDTVALTESREVPISLRVLATPWIRVEEVSLYRNDEIVATLHVPDSTETVRLEAEVSLRVSPGDFVMATARGPAGDLERVLPHSNGVPFAFTNPIWFSRIGTPNAVTDATPREDR